MWVFLGLHKYLALIWKTKGDIDATMKTKSRAIYYKTLLDEDFENHEKIFSEL